MANKKRNRGARGRSNGYPRSRSNEGAVKKSGEKMIALVIVLLLAIVAAVALILEFCTPYKPSNGFKKEVIPKEEQTDTIPESGGSEEAALGELNVAEINIEHTAGKTRPYASTYSDTVAPACEHVPETIENPYGSMYGALTISNSYTGSGRYYIMVKDDVTGVSLWGGRLYLELTEYSVYASYTHTEGRVYCIHDASQKGYAYFVPTDGWGQLLHEETYDATTDTLQLTVFLQYYNPSSRPNFPTSFKATNVTFVPQAPPTQVGYTFTGWYTDEECTNRYEGYTITGDTTLYAGWQINTYTLTLDANGGQCASSVSGEYNTVPTIPTPTRTGYTFTEWHTADGAAYDVTSPLTQDLTLTAQWQINDYTVTLDANGGELSATSVSGNYGDILTISTPTRTGYTFTGWNTAYGEAYDTSMPLTQDLTLTAQWQINTYTLTLNENGGELSATSVSGEYNTVPEIPTPTRTGYNFMGWKTAGGAAYDTSTPLTQDLTLTAQWQIKTYTVTFMVDGEVYQTMTVEHGTKLAFATKAAEPALFALYSVNEVGASLAADYAIDGDVTVYAEEGSTAQKVKGNWKRIAIVGACGAVLIAALCSIPAIVKRAKGKK